MNRPKLKFEHLIYAAVFLLAIGIRLAGAATRTLTNSEADLALQALALSRGQDAVLGPHPAYLVLTAAMMFLFGAGDWVARFWPAILGSLLVLLPLLFRAQMGKLPAVLLALFLAFDPALLAVSRQAGSIPFALFFSLLAFGLWLNHKTTLAGIAAGMALISGPQVWPGLLGLGAAAWLTRGQKRESVHNVGSQPMLEESVESIGAEPAPESAQILQGWRIPLIFALVTMFFAGTLFFTIPTGLSAMADSIPAYLRGWTAGSTDISTGVPVSLLLIALLLYELFPLFFGLWGGLQSLLRRSGASPVSRGTQPVDRFLLVWFLIAFILALIYPARQVVDLCWAILPLWGLAARHLARLVIVPAYDRLPALGHMVLTAMLLGYISMALVLGVNGTPENTWEYQVRIGGAVLMLLASTGLIAWGWSPLVSLRGFSWGVGIILFLFMVSAGWNSVGLSGRGEELWTSRPSGSAIVRDADLLTATIRDLSVLNRTISGGPDLVVVGDTSSSLRWLLRDVKRLRFASQLPTDTSPALVITTTQPELALASTYRGQDLVLGESIRWQQFGLAEWLRWWMLRSTPSQALQQEWGILWARADLFPDGLENTSSIP